MNECNIYGAGLIYGEGLIYSDWCKVLLYDFGIDLYDSTTTLPISGFYWSLYKRDPNISDTGIIDVSHTLVDSGLNIQDILEINLDVYSLRNINNDFLITASMSSSASNAPDLSSVYVKYYHTDYVLNTENAPYLHNSIAVNSGYSSSCYHGIIQIEPERWQLISVPIQYGYWDSVLHKHVHDDTTVSRVYNYIVEQIQDTYSVPAETMIEVFNTYIGDINKYYNFLPGVTDPLSEHNFELAYQDGVYLEYTGFWVKSIHNTPFEISWGEQP